MYTRERRRFRVCSLAFQSEEKKRGSFLCSSDMLIAIYFEIEFLLENGLLAEVVRRSHSSAPPSHNLEVKAFIGRFRCMIWEIRHWKTPPDHHLNCVIIPSLEWSVTRMIIKNSHFALVRKPSKSLVVSKAYVRTSRDAPSSPCLQTEILINTNNIFSISSSTQGSVKINYHKFPLWWLSGGPWLATQKNKSKRYHRVMR